MSNILIATPQMAEEIFNLAEQSNATSTQNNKVYWSKQMLDSFISNKDSFVLVYRDEDNLSGAIVCMYSPEFNKLHIENLFVKPDKRGNNIGESLVNETLRYAKQKGAKYVCALNSQINEYLNKLGFEQGSIFCWYNLK